MVVVVDYAESPGRVWNVASALVLFGLGVAFVTPFITQPAQEKLFDASFWFNENLPHWYDLSNPNMVAGTLAVLVPLALALALGDARGLRFIGSIALLPMLIMLVLLQGRGGIAALLAGITVFAVLYRRRLLILVSVGMVVLLLAVQWTGINLNVAQAAGSLEGRRQVWQFASGLLFEQPLGIGLNAYSSYADVLMGDLFSIPQRGNAHNLFLTVGLDTGLVGLAAFTALLGYGLYASWHAYRREVKRTLAIGIFAALVAAMVQGLFENNMWGNKSAIVLWALLGMCIVLGRFGARGGARRRRRTDERL
jgi:O-antigen ligase